MMHVIFFTRFVVCHDATLRERAFHYLCQLQAAVHLEFPRGSSVRVVEDELLRGPWSPLGKFTGSSFTVFN